MSDEKDAQHGVQSFEVGAGVLRAVVRGQRLMTLKDIAAAAEMPPSKAHRYLVSLIRTGLIEQDPLTSRYKLGPFSLDIGLVALDRLDRVRLGLSAISDLRDRINETVGLAVWGDHGPVIVRWERPQRPITVNVVTGTSLPLLTSASGRVFAAWLPKSQTAAQISKELKARAKLSSLTTRSEVDAMLAKIRVDGIAPVTQHYVFEGVQAVAAPVFNFKNQITMSISVVGVEGMSDLQPDSPLIDELKKAAAALSWGLGATRALTTEVVPDEQSCAVNDR
ncbi:IclR family transcriptional regulator [Simplicispira psychrophila]|uniref:IclR family transcriptional regulator n=1 Tax=Simplicispira psychrophila TaxID=80882 RepID=UPI00068BB216|nr:IclR family transcriptional regulator [Simplicispira psychrophila]